jgi:hypothetical protein
VQERPAKGGVRGTAEERSDKQRREGRTTERLRGGLAEWARKASRREDAVDVSGQEGVQVGDVQGEQRDIVKAGEQRGAKEDWASAVASVRQRMTTPA